MKTGSSRQTAFSNLTSWALRIALIQLCCGAWPDSARAERVFPELSAAREESSNVSKGMEYEWRNSIILKSNSSDLPEYQRDTPTLVSGLRAYGVVDLTNRVQASAEPYVAYIQSEESETSAGPETSASAQSAAYGGRFSLAIATESKTEFGAAAELRGETEQELKRNNAGLKSTSRRNGFMLFRPGFVLKKREAQWTAGAYYDFGDDEKVSATTEVLDDKRTTEDYVTLPPRFGAFFDIGLGGTMRIGTELSFIKGSASSLRAGSDPVFDNSYRAQFHLLLGDRDKDAVWIAISYQTLSYASQSYVSFDSIPVTDLEVAWTTEGGWLLGGILSYSEDKQSTAEINRDFTVYGIGLRLGLKMPNP